MHFLRLVLMFFGLSITAIQCHPVWDTSLIDGSPPIDFDHLPEEKDLLPIDQRGILDFIDRVVSGAVVISCATRLGLKGKCNIGSSCATLGRNETPTPCPGRMSSFLKCCPTEKLRTTKMAPSKVEGCGKRPLKTANLIVGGEEAIPHSWPWATALYRVNSGRNYFQCGGTILNNRIILTAAHCVKRPFQTLTAADFVVKVGAHHLDSSGSFAEVEQIITHENYSPTYHNDDIALLRLKVPLDFSNEHLAPVCLPSSAASDEGRHVGLMTNMVGWGVQSPTSGASSPLLHEVQVPISSQRQCKKAYTELMGAESAVYLNWNNTFCASYEQGEKDTCKGDSGSSSTVLDESTNTYTQIGIVSFGYGCAQAGYPGVYTYVNKYLGWIAAHMQADS